MQAVLEDIPTSEHAAFATRRFLQAGWPFNWHLHPEHELTLVRQGTGRRYVGDSIEDFGPGDLVLLASNVPHTWQSDVKSEPWCESIVAQFRDDALGPGFFDLPELAKVRDLLKAAQRGLRFPDAQDVAKTLETLPDQAPPRRLLVLLDCLYELADRPGVSLSSEPASPRLRPRDRSRIDAVSAYVQSHYAEPISLDEVAGVVHMSRTAFCRFFQRVMGRTFMQYLHELRVSQACRLLTETDLPIADIGFRVGFGNLANFNRVFKRLRGVTPSVIRRGGAGVVLDRS
ncbi:MAG: AraC family transcriptional regulator [Planctomycetota bacterium]